MKKKPVSLMGGCDENPDTHRDNRRRQFIQLLDSTDRYWMEVLGNKLFHDLNYYDLFTRMWLELDGTYCKSELYQLMPNVSQRTAIKYIQAAIDHGLLVEHIDPQDLRSKRIAMSDDLRQKIELFLDYSISVFEEFPLPSHPASALQREI
ncbi:MAG TPA: MarR family transcriptional regulator [Nitrosospira sp.]|nr:MarR family transcriptional regulator [Nitrosospira sp.]